MSVEEESYNPYCEVCSGCGEDGCCSAMICQHSKDGAYCETYLADLRFAYLMFKDMWELVDSEEGKKKLDEIYDKNRDLIYRQEKV